MASPPPTLRRWKRVDYERLVDLGRFQGEPLELIGGRLVAAEPQGSYHAAVVGAVVGAVDDAVRAMLPPGFIVRAQMPVALDYRESHPMRPALVVEVADSSLDFDRRDKGGLYARAGVQDYWIVNLIDHVLEVRRDPGPDPSAPHGWRYRSVETRTRLDIVAPLSFPSMRIAIADLLL